jgi:broad specificity phosphatase PhoE
MTYDIYLLRHGASTGNQLSLRQGQLDYPLSAEGEDQIRRLAAHWHAQHLEFDAIVSSPLARARRSADILSEVLSAPVSEDPLWMERHAGEAQGTLLQASHGIPKQPRPHAYEPLFKDGETRTDLHARATTGLQALLSRPPGTYLVVSHGGILGAAVRAAIGLQPSGWNTPVYIRFDNAAYAELVLDDARQTWSIVHVNARVPDKADDVA